VLCLLDRGADPNILGGDYGSALGVASQREALLGLAQLLLDGGALVNVPGSRHTSPLGAAAYTENTAAFQLLLDAGADVNAGGGKHGSPLGEAAASGWGAGVRMLLDAGARVDGPAPGAFSCSLGVAAYYGLVDTMRQLLRAGADVNYRGGPYGCPLGDAAAGGEADVTQLLHEAAAQMALGHGGRHAARHMWQEHTTGEAIGRLHVLPMGGASEGDSSACDEIIAIAVLSEQGDVDTVRLLLRWWAEGLSSLKNEPLKSARQITPASDDTYCQSKLHR
jgi:hypothetical protein